jgi:hypothetical protein
MTNPVTYMDLNSGEFGSLREVASRVKETDAWAHGKFEQALEEANRRMAEKSRQETTDFVDERFMDFVADADRVQEILEDGRRHTKFFDLAPTGGSK